MSKTENNDAAAEKAPPVLTAFNITPLTNSRYINPYRLTFQQGDMKRVWDGIQCHPSVSCILYNTDRRCLVLVRQFRPVVYVNQVIEASEHIDVNSPTDSLRNLDWSAAQPERAFTYELCAGLCDKNKSLEETIGEEIMEECGYAVRVEDIHRVQAFRMGVGLIGALHTVFYAEVSDAMRTGAGGGNRHEGEYIELYELAEDRVREFVEDEVTRDTKPPGLLFALLWFMHEREAFVAKRRKSMVGEAK